MCNSSTSSDNFFLITQLLKYKMSKQQMQLAAGEKNDISKTWRAIFLPLHPANQIHPLSYLVYWMPHHRMEQFQFSDTAKKMISFSAPLLRLGLIFILEHEVIAVACQSYPLLMTSEFIESLSCMTWNNNNSAPALRVQSAHCSHQKEICRIPTCHLGEKNRSSEVLLSKFEHNRIWLHPRHW